MRPGRLPAADTVYGETLDVSGRDELAAVAGEFNRMSAAVKESYDRLDQRVEERTAELAHLHRQLAHKEKMASLGTLAAGLAHEIGNPLASMSSELEILEDAWDPAEARASLPVLREQILRVSRLLRELLDLGREPVEHPERFQPIDVLRQVERLIRHDPRTAGIDVVVREPPAAVELVTHRDGLLQVLLNLALNAVDALDGEGSVTFEIAEVDGMVRLSVADTGPGMAEDVARQAFDPFFTTKPPGRGTGLGLFVSERRVHTMGAAWSCRHRQEKGPGPPSCCPVPSELEGMMGERILVVDDEATLRANIVRFLARRDYEVVAASSAEEALEVLAASPFDVVITDVRMPGMSGLQLLEAVTARWPDTLVLLITAHASADTAIEALRLGAQDYVVKPLSLKELLVKVQRLLEHRELQLQVRALRQSLQTQQTDMIAAAPSMQPVLRMLERAARSSSTVLILGETGTGKELAARALHDQSPWASKAFIPVNLAAQPAELVDATLFGHQKGAYTGAGRSREGVFRAAHGGTVFLDEIGELPGSTQVKLLRLLENREVLPLGADKPVKVSFRLIAATNRDLEAEVACGRFRSDLFFRLDVLRLTLPPLRERLEDLGALTSRFVASHARMLGVPTPRVASGVMRRLEQHRWPGNIRELSNVLERAVLLADEEKVTVAELPPAIAGYEPDQPSELKEAVAAFERRHIQATLRRHPGDKPAVAKELGVHLATLYRHLRRLGLMEN